MNAATQTAEVHDFAPRRMTPDDYRAERTRIEQTYGSSSAEAGAHRDQALAALYHRSGWTQDELAKVEGITQSVAGKRMRFGRFLSFSPTGTNPRNLTERRFRSYWEQTEKNPNERIRFAAVMRLIEEDTRIGKSTAPKTAIGTAIVEQFADGKWHKLPTILAHVEAEAADVEAVLDGMLRKGTYSSHCERKQVGTSHAYRIVRKSGKTVDVDVLTKELEPILNKLKLIPEIRDVARPIAKLGIEGIGWQRRVVEGAPVASGDDQYKIFSEKGSHAFLIWLNEVFSIKTPELKKVPIVAAMYTTFSRNDAEARKFWDQVARGGIEFEDNAPSTILDTWLKAAKEGELKEELKPAQFYQGCVYAWNAYREGKTIKDIRADTKKSWYQPVE